MEELEDKLEENRNVQDRGGTRQNSRELHGLEVWMLPITINTSRVRHEEDFLPAFALRAELGLPPSWTKYTLYQARLVLSSDTETKAICNNDDGLALPDGYRGYKSIGR